MNLKNRYYLVRHGEADYNLTRINDSHGEIDNHLTLKGILEIEVCAKNFADKNIVFEKIISSPFPRARESAEIFLKYVNVGDKKICYTVLLKEMNHGSERSGMPIVKEERRETAYDELHTRHGDGECFWDVRERASKLLKELENKYEGKVFLIVTHGSPMWMLYSAANGLTEEETLIFKEKRSTEAGYFIKNADTLLVG